jgi:nitronate monooxygenase
MLSTRFSEMFGLSYPVMSAPMTMHVGPTLASAVSAAGGLGSFAGSHPSGDPESLRSQVGLVRAATERPFAIGFITAFLPFIDPLFAAALEARPAAVALSFGDPEAWIVRCKAAGVAVICQIQTSAQADRAVAAGADVLAAQGTEAGGHTGLMATLPLLADVVARHPSVPVLAAGGIGNGRTLAAALAAGADGAWLGTAFLATPEAIEIDDAYRHLIVDSDGSDTVLTRAYDIVSPYPWPTDITERVRRNRFTDEWSGREDELLARKDEVAEAMAISRASAPDDLGTREVMYGQSAAFITEIKPAGSVLRSLCDDAETHLRARADSVLATRSAP